MCILPTRKSCLTIKVRGEQRALLIWQNSWPEYFCVFCPTQARLCSSRKRNDIFATPKWTHPLLYQTTNKMKIFGYLTMLLNISMVAAGKLSKLQFWFNQELIIKNLDSQSLPLQASDLWISKPFWTVANIVFRLSARRRHGSRVFSWYQFQHQKGTYIFIAWRGVSSRCSITTFDVTSF